LSRHSAPRTLTQGARMVKSVGYPHNGCEVRWGGHLNPKVVTLTDPMDGGETDAFELTKGRQRLRNRCVQAPQRFFRRLLRKAVVGQNSGLRVEG
jgi:hypothetical protein